MKKITLKLPSQGLFYFLPETVENAFLEFNCLGLTLMADGAYVNLVFSSRKILRDLRTIKDVFSKNGNQFWTFEMQMSFLKMSINRR